MKKIYFDNAATTQPREEVIREMVRVLENEYGNPSSTHSIGRGSKAIIESSRKTIAKLIGAHASEIIFTSSATEATNWILNSCVVDLEVKRIITSKIEHHATLYTIESLSKKFDVIVEYVNILPDGNLDYEQIESLLDSDRKSLLSLMHVNNETGVINDVKRISELCKSKNVLFHCDTVQSVGKLNINLMELSIDFIVASAHKFHGPKGIGFAYVRKGIILQPLLYGGEQEKGWRAGTEAVHQIAGMAVALDLSYQFLDEEQSYINELKEYCISKMKVSFPEMKLNGSHTLYNIINVLLPFDEAKTAMILFHLDMQGIAVSRGSACQSGSQRPSHVLAEMLKEEDIRKPSLRISFSHYNTKEEIDVLVSTLEKI